MIKLILTNCFNKEIEFSAESVYKAYHTVEGLSTNSAKIEDKQGEVGSNVSAVKIEPKEITIEGEYKVTGNNREYLIATVLPGSPAVLRYIDTSKNLDVYLDGYVVDSPEVTNTLNKQKYQFVFFSPYPYWKKTQKTVDKFYSFESSFSFPQSYPSDHPFMISTFYTKQIICTVNNSSNDVGYVVKVNAKGPVRGFTLTNVITQEKIKMKDSFTINSDDEFVIIIGDKKTSFKLNGVNVFKDIDKVATSFFKLHPGDNVLQYDVLSGVELVTAQISYKEELAGV